MCALGIARGLERANVTQIARAKAGADCERKMVEAKERLGWEARMGWRKMRAR